jgi:transposase
VEGDGGMGHLLAQQLLAAGERVLDVQPKLGARVRLLAAGDTNKNAPNDARSVPWPRCARPASGKSGPMITPRFCRYGPSITGIWARPAPRWSAACTRSRANRSPAASPKQLSPATQPAFWSPSSLRGCEPARWELAAEFPGDLRHIDAQPCQTRKKLAAAVRASGTSLTGLFGVGPVIAATVIGGAGEASRFPGRAHFAAYNGTAPMRLVDRMAFELLTARGNLPPQLIWVCPKKSSGSAQDMVKTIT